MDVERKDPKPMPLSVDGTSLKRKRRNRSICLSLVALVLLFVIIVVILAFTAFKPKRPVTTVQSVSLRDFNADLDVPRFRVRVNVTLDVDLTVRNPNKVGFRYSDSSAVLKYRGDVVGDAPIPAGQVSAGETVPMNLTLTILADRFLSNSNIMSDVVSGTLPLTSETRISGKVRVVFQVHVVSYATCDLTVNVLSRSLGNQTCRYTTKL